MNTTESILACIQGIIKCTLADAKHILEVYKREKVIKIDVVNGSWHVTHGAFLDADVLRRAIKA